ncbi:parallel beta-helix repeat protein [Krasilnikovia cinnamomea]|uniref:Parallel beta-helix repeat protein n=1 Tax=Krasilnikovia cinnamomea TaxID=349313 RepID=A0A4Q7ZSE2_9ACTN|nr:right-handed parallel beta-helix repeat-containing protein [Krasilnikovia cinnamomea]RZU53425.1 parallel beta-helix repeat protein [Krasilnikovia cinnamomea]
MQRRLLWSTALASAVLVTLAGSPAAIAAPASRIRAHHYYVSGFGSDSNNGLSPAAPFRNIQRAADLTNPGDTVYIMNGTYGDTSTEGVVQVTRSGAPGRVITYRSMPGHRPVLKPVTGWNGIVLIGASYITIQGLEIKGDSQNITLEQATAGASASQPRFNTNCINTREDRTTGALSHHLTIRGNYLHHCPGAGIGIVFGDHVLVEHNRIHSTSWYTVFGTSGVSVYEPVDVAAPAVHQHYKITIQNNVSYDNENKIKWIGCGCISDGNGIIVDDTLHKQSGKKPYTGKILVANNIVFDNGGSGIHAFSSKNVDIVHNTAYLNSRSPALSNPNIGAWFSVDVNLLNNISYARAGKATTFSYGNSNVRYDFNVYFGGLPPQAQGPHDIIADPGFVNPGTDPATANFCLRPHSPAVDSGTGSVPVVIDYYGTRRPQGAAVDRGAIERIR